MFILAQFTTNHYICGILFMISPFTKSIEVGSILHQPLLFFIVFYASCRTILFAFAMRRILSSAYRIRPRAVFMLTSVESAISLNDNC